MAFSRRFVRSLRLQQLPSHLDLQVVFDCMVRSAARQLHPPCLHQQQGHASACTTLAPPSVGAAAGMGAAQPAHYTQQPSAASLPLPTRLPLPPSPLPACPRMSKALLHPPPVSVCSTPTLLSISYGMRGVGMEYDASLFGMTLADCRCLALALGRTETLVTLQLRGNGLDDEQVGVGGGGWGVGGGGLGVGRGAWGRTAVEGLGSMIGCGRPGWQLRLGVGACGRGRG